MSTLLIRDAKIVATMDAALGEVSDGWILCRDGAIVEVGAGAPPTSELQFGPTDEIVDASGCVATPGLINTHHHLFQNLTRAVPDAQDAPLFDWLTALYPIWARLEPDDIRLSTTLGLAELALSGCSTTSDHLYLFPNGARVDDQIAGAADVGVRLTATRGAMSVGESAGGLPPDALCEDEAAILKDMDRVVAAHHDATPAAMVQVALAPCSPFSVSEGLMRDTATLARSLGVRLHTHLAEDADDVAYSLERFGVRPGAYAERVGWTGPDVWHAHCVKLDAEEIRLFARTGAAVAHCPCSNMRLGSGIAPIREMRDAGVVVGIGVDGSASNDAADLIGEARQAMLLQRVAQGAAAMSAREALEIATLGGAAALGRPELGRIGPGARADIALWDVERLEAAGAWDPVAALVLTGPHRVRDLFVEGRGVVRDGALATLDLHAVQRGHAARAARLANG